MSDCRYQQEIGELKQFHLEIIDRLARIETKQDNVGILNASYQNEIAQLCHITNEQGKEIAALDREIKNLKWLAGMVAGIVAGVIQLLSFIFKWGR